MKQEDLQNILDSAMEVRAEITRVNQAAGRTIFNPTATEFLDGAIQALKEELETEFSLPEYANDAATIGIGSDRYAATHIATDEQGIHAVRRDHAKVVSGTEMDGSAKYIYTPNENGSISYFRARNDTAGSFEEVRKNPDTGRWNKAGHSYRLSLGRRNHYMDPSF